MEWSWSEIAGLLFVVTWVAGVIKWFWRFPWATKWRCVGLAAVIATGVWAGKYGGEFDHPRGMLVLAAAVVPAILVARMTEWIAAHPPKGSEAEVSD